jgi:hypothetical protein
VSALTVGLAAGTAVAHDRGHHDDCGAHRGHALAGMVQSVDPSANTAIVTLGGSTAMMTAVLAVDRAAARQDVASGTAVPVAKLVDWGAPSAGGHVHHHHGRSDIRRFTLR